MLNRTSSEFAAELSRHPDPDIQPSLAKPGSHQPERRSSRQRRRAWQWPRRGWNGIRFPIILMVVVVASGSTSFQQQLDEGSPTSWNKLRNLYMTQRGRSARAETQ